MPRACMRATRTFVALLFVLACNSGVRAELAYGAGYTVSYESNPTRVVDSPGSDVMHELLGGFAYEESTSTVRARALGQVETRRYRRDSFPDDTFLYFDGLAVWSIVPRTFDWTVEDNLGQARLDFNTPDTPANRAQSNTFSTGPDVTLRLGSATNLELGGRYGRYDLEDLAGNERAIATARLRHLLSGASTLTANYEYARIRLEPPSVVTKSTREDLYLRYDSRTSTANEFNVEVGATRVVTEDEEGSTHPRVALSYARQLTAATAFRVSVSDYVSDAFTDSLNRETLFLATPPGNQEYRAQAVIMNLSSVSGALSYGLQGYVRRIDYEEIDNDYDEGIGRLDLVWQSSADLRYGANAEYIRRDFLSTETMEIEKTAVVGATYFLTRTFSVTLDAGYQEVENTATPGVVKASRYRAILGYSTGPTYVPRPRR